MIQKSDEISCNWSSEADQNQIMNAEASGSPQEGLSSHLIRNRENPINGRDCFFSEASFRRVIGPEPSFEEKLLLQLSRIKTEKQKSKPKDLDKPKEAGVRVEAVTVELSEEETAIIDTVPVCSDSQSSPEKLSSSFSDDNAQLGPATDSLGTEEVDKTCTASALSVSSQDDHNSILTVQDDHSDGSELMISEEVDDRVTENITEVQLSRNDSDPEKIESSEDIPKSPPSDLCLVLPSLSSDEDDDNNENDDSNSFLYPSYSHSADTGTSKASLESTEIKLVQPKPVDKGEEGTNELPFSQVSQLFQDSTTMGENSFLPGEQNPHACNTGPTFQADACTMSWQTIVHNASVVDSQAHALSQSTWHMDKASSASASWSESDIPIFSVKEASPEAGKCEPVPKSTRCHKKNSVWSMEVSSPARETKSSGDISGDSAAAKEAVKKALKFKQSDLTKAEHRKYLMFFNKYVKPYMLGGQPPVFTQRQLNEVTEFEKLQRRVLDEQTEFQNYLQDNAKRNPQAYTFLKKAARHYASSKAHSYHLNKKHVLKFSQNVQTHIPLCYESGSAELKFVQTLLEVGLPPRISLPDIQSGNKPVPIPHNIKKLDSWFPRQSKKNIPGYIHHEPVSFDNNVKSLVMKYNVQLVMSSSVVKCLLDNHGPNFDRAWHIPVSVVEHRSEGGHHTVVYLDKPVFEDNLLTRDYSALFHKYCLRTFVSLPKHRRAKETVFPQSSNRNMSAAADDPFDMFSTDIDSLETFGVGQDKPSDFTLDEEMESNISHASSELHEKSGEKAVTQDSKATQGNSLNVTAKKDEAFHEQISEDVQDRGRTRETLIQKGTRSNTGKGAEKVISKPNEASTILKSGGRVTRSKTQTKTAWKVDKEEPSDSSFQISKDVSGAAIETGCSGAGKPVNELVDTHSESDRQMTGDLADLDTKASHPRRDSCSCEPPEKKQKAVECHENMQLESVTSTRRSGRLLSKGSHLQSNKSETRSHAPKEHNSHEKMPTGCTESSATMSQSPNNNDVAAKKVSIGLDETSDSMSPQEMCGTSTKQNAENSNKDPAAAEVPTLHARRKRGRSGKAVDSPPQNTAISRNSENVEGEHGKKNAQNQSITSAPANSPLPCDVLSSSSMQPLSPIASPSSTMASPPASPPPDPDNIQTSPFRTLPCSTVREIPSSPVHDTQSASPVAIPLSPEGSAIKRRPKSFFASPSSHQYHKASSENQARFTAGNVQNKLFSPLDSILGPSFGTAAGKEKQSISHEDPSHYLPPTEVCSSIVYNLWYIGNISVLIRSKCQGILKDHKKTRRVYLSPKMEYQTTYGLEQVTVNEVARDWASCYIRPNTNLLRARINAFTSEIMMFEELESHQILQSSLGFKPENAFQFLDRLFQQLTGLECGKYLLSHEAGTDYCGIHCQRQGASSGRPEAEQMVSRKKIGLDSVLRWIPIDPTILLPHHISNNRIPATFLPKDFVVTNMKPVDHKRKSSDNQKKETGMQNYNHQASYKKKGKKKK